MARNDIMNEYEAALYEAVRVLGLAVLEMDGNRNSIQAGMEEAQEAFDQDGRVNAAATMRSLLDSWLRPGTAYVPKPSN